jgi:hypothetical protein
MWPVQTLTLLLCLTDEEQLFAQNAVVDKDLPAVEAKAPEPSSDQDDSCIAPFS